MPRRTEFSLSRLIKYPPAAKSKTLSKHNMGDSHKNKHDTLTGSSDDIEAGSASFDPAGSTDVQRRPEERSNAPPLPPRNTAHHTEHVWHGSNTDVDVNNPPIESTQTNASSGQRYVEAQELQERLKEKDELLKAKDEQLKKIAEELDNVRGKWRQMSTKMNKINMLKTEGLGSNAIIDRELEEMIGQLKSTCEISQSSISKPKTSTRLAHPANFSKMPKNTQQRTHKQSGNGCRGVRAEPCFFEHISGDSFYKTCLASSTGFPRNLAGKCIIYVLF